MATYTTNYNLEKPAQTDIYNVDVFNDNADKIDAGLTDKAEKTMLAPVETTNSASRSYAKGEYFVYNNVLCCATTAIAAGGTIAIGTNCSTAPVGGELKSLKDAFTTTDYTSQIVKNADTSPAVLKLYKTGRLVTLEYVGGSLTHAMNEVLFTIPTACRPADGFYIYANANSNATGFGASVNIKDNGEVTALPQNTVTVHRLCFTLTYVSAS